MALLCFGPVTAVHWRNPVSRDHLASLCRAISLTASVVLVLGSLLAVPLIFLPLPRIGTVDLGEFSFLMMLFFMPPFIVLTVACFLASILLSRRTVSYD